METRDLRAIFAERKARLLATLDELHDTHRATVLAIIEECDRRIAGDTSALSVKSDVRARIGRCIADVLEATLYAYDMRGHGAPGTAQWQDRKADIIRMLLDAKKPTRTARRMVAAAVTYGDALTCEILSSPHSRVLLGSMGIDPRAVAIAAVKALAESAAGSLPGVRFCLLQESDASLSELVVYAQFLCPVYP